MCAVGKHESLKVSNKNIPWKVNPEALTDFFKKKNILSISLDTFSLQCFIFTWKMFSDEKKEDISPEVPQVNKTNLNHYLHTF